TRLVLPVGKATSRENQRYCKNHVHTWPDREAAGAAGACGETSSRSALQSVRIASGDKPVLRLSHIHADVFNRPKVINSSRMSVELTPQHCYMPEHKTGNSAPDPSPVALAHNTK